MIELNINGIMKFQLNNKMTCLMLIIFLIIQIVLVITSRTQAHFLRVTIIVRISRPIQRTTLTSLALHYIQIGAAMSLLAFSKTTSLGSWAHDTVAALARQVFLEDGLTRGAVLAWQISASVFSALLDAIRLDDVFVVARVQIYRHTVDAQFANAAEEAVRRTDVIEYPMEKKVLLVLDCYDYVNGYNKVENV